MTFLQVLTNRKKLLENISEILKNENENLAFFFIDLDKFKAINDSFGHEAGDMVLAKVAERLENNTSPTDIVSRIGGDEFIVIIRNLMSSSSATKIAEKLVKVLSDAFIYNEELLYIGASVGISVFPQHGTDADTLIKNADLAMYEVKNRGGQGYILYDNIMDANNKRMLETEKNLKDAMKKNEFITVLSTYNRFKINESIKRRISHKMETRGESYPTYRIYSDCKEDR